MPLDRDVRAMSAGEARQEVMRIRRLAETLAKKSNNDMCWLNIQELCQRILGRPINIGKITLPKKAFLKNCGRFYDRQTCRGCPAAGRPHRR